MKEKETMKDPNQLATELVRDAFELWKREAAKFRQDADTFDQRRKAMLSQINKDVRQTHGGIVR